MFASAISGFLPNLARMPVDRRLEIAVVQPIEDAERREVLAAQLARGSRLLSELSVSLVSVLRSTGMMR
jgi:hypothetical protein